MGACVNDARLDRLRRLAESRGPEALAQFDRGVLDGYAFAAAKAEADASIIAVRRALRGRS